MTRNLTPAQLAEAIELGRQFADRYRDSYTEMSEVAKTAGERIGWEGEPSHFDAREDGWQWWTATEHDSDWFAGVWANSPAEAAIRITAGHGITPDVLHDDPHSELFHVLSSARKSGSCVVQLRLF